MARADWRVPAPARPTAMLDWLLAQEMPLSVLSW
jgi:hypothetical protein